MREGARFQRHGHLGHGEIPVMEGRMRVAGATLESGDYPFTEPGEVHDVLAPAMPIIYVGSRKQTPAIE